MEAHAQTHRTGGPRGCTLRRSLEPEAEGGGKGVCCGGWAGWHSLKDDLEGRLQRRSQQQMVPIFGEWDLRDSQGGQCGLWVPGEEQEASGRNHSQEVREAGVGWVARGSASLATAGVRTQLWDLCENLPVGTPECRVVEGDLLQSIHL